MSLHGGAGHALLPSLIFFRRIGSGLLPAGGTGRAPVNGSAGGRTSRAWPEKLSTLRSGALCLNTTCTHRDSNSLPQHAVQLSDEISHKQNESPGLSIYLHEGFVPSLGCRCRDWHYLSCHTLPNLPFPSSFLPWPGSTQHSTQCTTGGIIGANWVPGIDLTQGGLICWCLVRGLLAA